MNEYMVQEVARQQLNDRIASASRARTTRRSTGRARRARSARTDGSAHVAAMSRPGTPLSRAGQRLVYDVRHPANAFRSWLSAGLL